MNAAEFLQWRDAYEAAGIDPNDLPPDALRALAASSGAVVASTAPRAIESAKALAPERDVLTSPLLRELELPPPIRGPIRLPLLGWALLIGVGFLVQRTRHGRHVSAEEVERARDAAAWMAELEQQHGTVVAVTHQSFRSLLGKQLLNAGWLSDVKRPGSRHWSAWTFRRSPSAPGR
jgi:hypothetical protein